MTELASTLGTQLGRFVVEETGLPGHYDFVLHWDPDQATDSLRASPLFTALHRAARPEAGIQKRPHADAGHQAA